MTLAGVQVQPQALVVRKPRSTHMARERHRLLDRRVEAEPEGDVPSHDPNARRSH
jgi:hypothetical protein